MMLQQQQLSRGGGGVGGGIGGGGGGNGAANNSPLREGGLLSVQSVASLPPPGMNGPTSPCFAPGSSRYLAFVGSGGGGASSSSSTNSATFRSSPHQHQHVPRSGQVQPAFYQPLVTGFSAGNNGVTAAAAASAARATTTTTTTGKTSSSSGGGGSGDRVLMCLDLSRHRHRQAKQQQQQQQQAQKMQTTPSPSASSEKTAPPAETAAALAAAPRPLLRIQHQGDAGSCKQQHNSRAKRRLVTDPAGAAASSDAAASSSASAAASSPASCGAASSSIAPESLQERLRRERQRMHLTQFGWAWSSSSNKHEGVANAPGGRGSNDARAAEVEEDEEDGEYLKVLVPARGSLWIQDGVAGQQQAYDRPDDQEREQNGNRGRSPSSGSGVGVSCCRLLHDKSLPGNMSAVDPQLSPDGRFVAWTQEDGELYVKSASASPTDPAVRLSYGAVVPTASASPATSSSQQQQHAPEVGAGSSSSSEFAGGRCITHGTADFVAQEEMDRYRGFWWHPDSCGILLTKVDESHVPVFRILHHTSTATSSSSSSGSGSGESAQAASSGAASEGGSEHQTHEDHRYPFAGKRNPTVALGFVRIDPHSILNAVSASSAPSAGGGSATTTNGGLDVAGWQRLLQQQHDQMASPAATAAHTFARAHWKSATWFEAPREASEYLARVYWVPLHGGGRGQRNSNHYVGTSVAGAQAVVQWQNRAQTVSVLQRLDFAKGKGRTLLLERNDEWINLHRNFRVLPRPIHPCECISEAESSSQQQQALQRSLPASLPPESFSFIFTSEVTGYSHLYLYTYVPGYNNDLACLVRQISKGEWMVESICGVDADKDVVYFTGTCDSVLERHLYCLPLTNRMFSQAQQLQQQQQGEDEEMSRVNPPNLTGSNDSNFYHSSTSSSSGGLGVRRGLSKMITAFSGGGHGSQASSVGVGSFEAHHRGEAAARTGALGAVTMNSALSIPPIRLTVDAGIHSIVMDDNCRYFVDTSSDLDRPTSVKIFEMTDSVPFVSQQPLCRYVTTLFDALQDSSNKALLSRINSTNQGYSPSSSNSKNVHAAMMTAFMHLPAPEMISFPTTDGSETLYAAVYKPDPRVHGPGPYPLICAVYGGPHVQRVNRSWSQCADMRAQRLRSLGFCVVKCDNRGSSRRGLDFEKAISKRLGRIEVLDQVACVRQMVMRGIADPTRVGIYGWSYGGYLSAMCLCRAPDVFQVAVAGAPVTSWDGYDTHYTERYMGLPADNPAGYRESAVFDHVGNMRGKLMIVHGLIDENVHFRHTARLINKLTAMGKDYELLIFPDERHSPRRLRDRIYMEQRISDFFIKNLSGAGTSAFDLIDTLSRTPGGLQGGFRAMAGHL